MTTKPAALIAIAVLPFCLSISMGAAASTTVTLASPFTDHMVLQRDQPLLFWGTATPGATVHVSIASTPTLTASGTADSTGRWTASLSSLPAGGPYEIHIDTDSDPATPPAATLRDVLIGDVWLCSGQSNMAFVMKRADNPDAIAQASNPQVRLFKVRRDETTEPLQALTTPVTWEPLTPKSAADFSAVAYYFSRDLHQHLDVPIGLVLSAVGGTPAEGWMSKEALAPFPEFKKELARVANARKLATKDPAVHYNAMIAPLVPLPIKGVIWYQGEANATRAHQYRTLFPAMIRFWRSQWNDPELPFLFVQLPVFHERKPGPHEDAWSELRDAQFHTFRTVPHTGMVVSVDTGDPKDIHPKDKEPIGVRLANAARAIAYGEDITWSGPLYTTATVEGSRIRVHFDHVGQGLTTTDLSTSVTGVAIAGADRKFHWADATIDSATNTLLVSSPDVPNPVAVRYAWAANPEANLISKQGLPASPFRTDDWPGLTHNKITPSRPPQK